MADENPRLQAQVDLEGGSVEEGARKLNPILQRIASRRPACDEVVVEADLLFSRLQFSKSFS